VNCTSQDRHRRGRVESEDRLTVTPPRRTRHPDLRCFSGWVSIASAATNSIGTFERSRASWVERQESRYRFRPNDSRDFGRVNAGAAPGRQPPKLIAGRPSNALHPAPARMHDSWGRDVPNRTSYVCGSFAIDRFGALASQTAASIRKNGRVAAADAWRAAVWPRFSSRVDLASSARVRRPEDSKKQGATLRT